MIRSHHPAHRGALSRSDPEGGAGCGVLGRLVKPLPGGSGPLADRTQAPGARVARLRQWRQLRSRSAGTGPKTVTFESREIWLTPEAQASPAKSGFLACRRKIGGGKKRHEWETISRTRNGSPYTFPRTPFTARSKTIEPPGRGATDKEFRRSKGTRSLPRLGVRGDQINVSGQGHSTEVISDAPARWVFIRLPS